MRGIHHNFDQQQVPAFFVRGPSPFARLTFFTALSLALMATDSRLQYLTSIRENLMTLLHPLQVIANAPVQLYHATDEYFSTHHYLLAENSRLQQQALMQDIALQRMNALNHENDDLRNLLEAKRTLSETSTLAEIIHVGRDSFTKKVIVNRGKNHHVAIGSAAVDAKGVVGQVTRVYASSSEITLITDKSLAIPVQIERNGLRAIAFGHGRDNALDLPYLPANVDIKRGDRLITSGIDGVYPSGLIVATVAEIKITADSPFANIVCKPAGGIDNSRQILLVSVPEILPEQDAPAEEPSASASGTAPAQATKLKTQPIPAEKTPQKPSANVESRPHAQQ